MTVSDNLVDRARASLEEQGDHPKDEISAVLESLEEKSAELTKINEARAKLKEDAVRVSRDVELAYTRLQELVPANPLGTLQIG